ncbi:MAG: type II toxin-antitoxin system RelE/ParE family toxin [Chloroflexota bacterium]
MYQLEFKEKARQQLRDLAAHSSMLHSEAVNIILDLHDDPYPPDALEMVDDYDGFYRIRFNNHRIIYRVIENEKTVIIWAIKPRSRATYKNLF